MEKKEAAKMLYMEGVTSKEIATLLGISENTVSKWATSEDWKAKRISKDLRDHRREETVLEIIDYQLSVIKSMTIEFSELQDDEGNTLPPRLIPANVADGLIKFYNMVKRQEMKWADMVKVLKEYSYYLAQNNPELAKQSIDYTQQFLNLKREQTL